MSKVIGSTKFGDILMTKDYDSFKTIGSNRRINALNYSKLLRSMKEEQLIIPICVNEKLEIIDGQHRVRVCRELGLYVYYYVLSGYSTAQMKRANLVSANWSKDDFLNAYVNEGNEYYQDFSTMKESYGINTSDLIKVIASVQDVSPASLGLDFEEGGLVLTGEDNSAVNDFIMALEDFKFFKDYKKARFVGAFLLLYSFPGYNHRQMVNRLKTRSGILEVKFSKDDYITLLANKIYSFGSTKGNIYYDPARGKLYKLD